MNFFSSLTGMDTTIPTEKLQSEQWTIQGKSVLCEDARSSLLDQEPSQKLSSWMIPVVRLAFGILKLAVVSQFK